MKKHFSKIGFVLAMAGSAVGLGNAWKFPTMVGQNGGSAFILLYLLLTFAVAFMVFLAEMSIGRITRKNPVAAFAQLGGSAWGAAGFFMVGAIIIACFYSVVIGWLLYYLCVSFLPLPADAAGAGAMFGALLGQGLWQQIACFSVVFLMIFFTVSRGIINGIERMNKFMMPALFVLLALMLAYAATVEGFGAAVEFIFRPDFSRLSPSSVLNALGLSFFSLSMGVCVVLTYAASLPERINPITSTLSIIAVNILVGLMMGLIIFTFVFHFNGDPSAEGPGLIFVSLISMFGQLGLLGQVLSIAFFIALLFAGLTSAVSMIEPTALYLCERFNLSRARALVYIGAFVYVVGICCILSFNESTAAQMQIFGRSLFDALDFLTSNILMPSSAFAVCVLVGYVVPREKLRGLFGEYMGESFFGIWLIFVRFIAPAAILVIFCYQLGLLDAIFK